MDISKKMVELISKRKKDEFNLGSDLIYEGIKLGEIRSKIGYRGIDISKNVKIEEKYFEEILCYKYYVNEETDYILFNIHGGGFYGGSAKVSEYYCKYMAEYGNIHIYNIEYTLAPDSKFGETLYEIYDIIKMVEKEYKNVKFGILGDSAGAHLAMNVALLDIKEKGILSYIFLMYPVISLQERKNWNISQYNLEKDSINAKAGILFLKSIMPLIKKLYVPNNIDTNTSFYNMLNISNEEKEKLPKIFLAKAQYDYFNLDIDEFCAKYSIECVEYKGLFHGFMEFMGYLDEVKELAEKIVDKFKGKI